MYNGSRGNRSLSSVSFHIKRVGVTRFNLGIKPAAGFSGIKSDGGTPMSTIIKTEVFQFDELSDAGKEKARQWWRDASTGDNYYSEPTIEEVKGAIGKALGFDVQEVYWSGFSSQGDGACFIGTWRAADVNAKALQQYAPVDKELAQIRKAMRAFARAHRNNTANITQIDRHYCHPYTVAIEADQDSEQLAEIARDFMRWIYRQIEQEYEYQYYGEGVDDTIRANEYTFTAEGARFG